MNTAEVVVTEICGTALLLGAGGLAVARQALKDGWVAGGISLRIVSPGKRWETRREATTSSGTAAGEGGSPAAVPAPLDGRRVA